MNAEERESTQNLKWTEAKLEEIVFEECFPSAIRNNESLQKSVIIRFFNFYLGGRAPKGLGVEDLVFPVFSMLPQSPYRDIAVWSPNLYEDDGKAFFLSPEEKLASDVHAVIRNSSNVQDSHEVEASVEQNSENIANSLLDLTENNSELVLPDDSDDSNDVEKFLNEGTDELSETNNENERSDSGSTNEVNNDWNNDNVSRDQADEAESQRSNFIDNIPNDIRFPLGEYQPVEKEDKILSYGPVENAAFISCCDRLLSEWENEKSRAVLKSFFAVVCFVLMRATTKGYKHLVTTFHSEKFHKLLLHSKICGMDSYSPPHKRCLKGAYRTFRRRNGRTPTMFAKLVLLGLGNTNKYLRYVIRNGLLNYTADYGFNLIRMIRTVCSKVDGEWMRVLHLTLCKETEESWKRVAAFLSEYCAGARSRHCLSYRWARVVDDSFFSDISCQQNYGLAVIMAVFVENMTGDPGIWQSTWVENEDLEKYRELGNKLYDERFIENSIQEN